MKLITRQGCGFDAKMTIHSGFYYLIVLTVAALIALPMWGCPRYAVWQQEMSGRAEFAKAEQNRQIKIEEAKANLEAEKLNARAEVDAEIKRVEQIQQQQADKQQLKLL